MHNALMSSCCYQTPKQKHIVAAVLQYLGVNTSTPTVTAHESRKVQESFMFAHNPDITWAVKVFPVYWRNPRQKLVVATKYPSLIVYLGLVSEVDLSSSFRLGCR